MEQPQPRPLAAALALFAATALPRRLGLTATIQQQMAAMNADFYRARPADGQRHGAPAHGRSRQVPAGLPAVPGADDAPRVSPPMDYPDLHTVLSGPTPPASPRGIAHVRATEAGIARAGQGQGAGKQSAAEAQRGQAQQVQRDRHFVQPAGGRLRPDGPEHPPCVVQRRGARAAAHLAGQYTQHSYRVPDHGRVDAERRIHTCFRQRRLVVPAAGVALTCGLLATRNQERSGWVHRPRSRRRGQPPCPCLVIMVAATARCRHRPRGVQGLQEDASAASSARRTSSSARSRSRGTG